METQSDFFQLKEQDYSPELVEAMEDYAAYKEQEATKIKPVTADQIPLEVKEAMGLDIFPEDMQNDILSLAQKIIDYGMALEEQYEQESPYRPQSTLGRIGMCLNQTPYRDLARDAWKSGGTAAQYSRFLPGPQGRAIRPLMRPAGAIATFAAGFTAYQIGCNQARGRFGR